MRLLNTKTHQLREFFEVDTPEYAILSHRWSGSEVSFKGFRKGRYDPKGAGYQKIIGACTFAQSRGQEWIWIDSCCIDKRSSAELSEAINLMWNWYKAAKQCYAYLVDVTCGVDRRVEMLEQFRNSDWFKRGWTLQELLAPDICLFCNSDWQTIGGKIDLINDIADITGISKRYLETPPLARHGNVAVKMSWASRRETTRPEDIAYSLLGLFDVNMPLLYGEGRAKAFIRLQLEIIRKSPDESIFAWCPDRDVLNIDQGLLALHPRLFAGSGDVHVAFYQGTSLSRSPYYMTHLGLYMQRDVYRLGSRQSYDPTERTTYYQYHLRGCDKGGTIYKAGTEMNILLRERYSSIPKVLERVSPGPDENAILQSFERKKPELMRNMEFYVSQSGM